MPVFVFQAKDQAGQMVKGQIEAGNEAEARIRLRAKKLTPVSVFKQRKESGLNFALSFFGQRVKPKELQIFTRQFATLINAGIPVLQSIEALTKGAKAPALGNTLNRVMNSIGQGRRLADALNDHPLVFDRLYVNMVKAGEEGGVLDTVLARLAEYIEKSVKIKSKIKGALWYPAAIMAVAFVIVAVIMVFVIPKFEQLFANSGQDLPALTRWVIAASHFFASYWWAILGVLGSSIYGVVSYYQTDPGREFFDPIVIELPVFGGIIQKGGIARFARTLSTLVSSGVGIMDALTIAGQVTGNKVLEKVIASSKTSIAEGKSIAAPLARSRYIPDMVVQMISIGEQTGALDTMLSKVADFYEDEVDVAVSAMMSMIEPMLMVFLGGIIAILVVAMYLPIFNLAGAVTGK